MLRMGRSPRVESNEDLKTTNSQPPAVNRPPAQTAPPSASQISETAPPPPRQDAPSHVTPRAISETESIARDLKDGIMSGFLGSGTILSGEAEFKGMLRIDGQFTGRITSEKGVLIVSAGARVDANVSVGTVKINGHVNGDVNASERLELGRSARLHGNISTPVLVVEQGAIFEGGCRMQQQPEQAKTTKAPPKSVATQTQAAVNTRPAPSKQADVHPNASVNAPEMTQETTKAPL